jgi:CheY-like chemotaxis protein
LGGEITAKSATPSGAVMSVALPPAARADARMPRPKTEAAPPPRGRVLVVDDEVAIAKLVERILRASYDVVVENDARVALGRIASGERFDVIFCDLMMPHLTGMDLYATLVASNPEVAKRFVFMTGGAFSERSREFLDKVEIVSIAKPFSAETLRTLARDFTR